MSAGQAGGDADDYDEFAFLEATAGECSLPWNGRPLVARREVEVAPGQVLSAIVWGEGPSQLVFLHGGGQNAHTWDTVALALGRPAVAIDLPGHGRSSWRADQDYSPATNAEAVAVALSRLAPNAKAVVGMSLGGATNIRLAAGYPELVKKAVFVDVTPRSSERSARMSRDEKGAVALVGGPRSYATFDEMADAAIALSPNRSPESVRRGVRHNAMKGDDGRWAWRYDRLGDRPASTFAQLWQDVSNITAPAMLVLGGASRFVADEDVAEMRRRKPDLRVEVVPGAGHAVQSDQPLVLTRLIEAFVFS